MNFHELTEKQDGAPEDSEATFRIFTMYDSPRSSAEADYVSGIVLRGLGQEVAVDRSSWELARLETPEGRATAAVEAGRADVIVVAVAQEEPSSSFREWAGTWQRNRALSAGLIALVPTGGPSTGGGLAAYLEQTASAAHMDFLCRHEGGSLSQATPN